jgi:hypothetical protein
MTKIFHVRSGLPYADDGLTAGAVLLSLFGVVCLLPAPLSFPLVVSLGVGNGITLHFAWRISPTTGNLQDVVDQVALAAPLADPVVGHGC